jgi:hypothetical protein
VTRLKRVKFGAIDLGDLAEAVTRDEWRRDGWRVAR